MIYWNNKDKKYLAQQIDTILQSVKCVIYISSGLIPCATAT